MKTKRIFAMAVAALSASICLGAGVQAPAEAAPTYKLLWSQEFNDKKVARPDPKVWDFDLTDGYGWGNSEQEYYRFRIESADKYDRIPSCRRGKCFLADFPWSPNTRFRASFAGYCWDVPAEWDLNEL